MYISTKFENIKRFLFGQGVYFGAFEMTAWLVRQLTKFYQNLGRTVLTDFSQYEVYSASFYTGFSEF